MHTSHNTATHHSPAGTCLLVLQTQCNCRTRNKFAHIMYLEFSMKCTPTGYAYESFLYICAYKLCTAVNCVHSDTWKHALKSWWQPEQSSCPYKLSNRMCTNMLILFKGINLYVKLAQQTQVTKMHTSTAPYLCHVITI